MLEIRPNQTTLFWRGGGWNESLSTWVRGIWFDDSESLDIDNHSYPQAWMSLFWGGWYYFRPIQDLLNLLVGKILRSLHYTQSNVCTYVYAPPSPLNPSPEPWHVQLPLFARIVEAPATPGESPPVGWLDMLKVYGLYTVVSQILLYHKLTKHQQKYDWSMEVVLLHTVTHKLDHAKHLDCLL